MSYGIRLNNVLGRLNITDDSYAIRLHDTGTTLVPAASGATEGTIVINIKSIRYIPLADVVDIDSSVPVWGSDLGVYITMLEARDANNQYHQVCLYNSSTSSRWVRWRVWGFK